MKLSKAIIVSGILFSSVLGSINTSTITTFAGTQNGSTLPSKKDNINVVYLSGDKEIGSTNINTIIGPNETVDISAIKAFSNQNYRIKDGQTFKVFIGKDNVKTINVQLEKLKSIKVRYVINGQSLLTDDMITVTDNTKTIGLNQIPKDLKKFENLRIIENKTIFNIDNDNVVRVYIETIKDVSIIYNNEDGTELTLPIGNVKVLESELNLKSNDIPAPAGYEVIPGQQVSINKNGKNNFARIKVRALEVPESSKPDVNIGEGSSTKPNTKPSTPARYAVQRVRITYVNKATNEEVGYLQLIGKDSFSKKTEAPKGYVFLNEKDATVKFDKKGNKDIKVYVKQMTSAPIKHEGTVTTSNGQYKRLFNLDGKAVKNRALSAGTSWHTDQYAVVNGEKMYRVATTEWVKAADVL